MRDDEFFCIGSFVGPLKNVYFFSFFFFFTEGEQAIGGDCVIENEKRECAFIQFLKAASVCFCCFVM